MTSSMGHQSGLKAELIAMACGWLAWAAIAACAGAADKNADNNAYKKKAVSAAAQPGKPASAGEPAAAASKDEGAELVPDTKHAGGEPDGIVQVANLVYAGYKSSECFADHFLIKAEEESAVSTSRRFHAVKLSSEDVYDFPLLIMTGEGAFDLSDVERQNLRQFIERGGFLLASAGCSSEDWDRSLRRELAAVFPEYPLTELTMDHPVFHTVHDIDELVAAHGTPKPLEGVSIKGRLGIIYSQDGLNDTAHTQGCCCCGGNEITNAIDVNLNILAYALTY